jgi:hypothetical protein
MSIIVHFIHYFNYLNYFFVLMCIIQIIAIIYCGLNRSSEQAYGVRYWVSYPEIICRHSRQLSQQKYCQSLVMCAPPFWPTTPRKRCWAPSCPSAGRAQGCHRAAYSAQSLSYRCTAKQSKWQRFRTRISAGSRPRTWWIIVFTWHLSPCCALCRTVTQCHQPPPLFVTYHGTSPTPTSWQTTSHIRRWHLACGRRVRPERSCAGGTEWVRCLQQVRLQVFPGYFEWRWRREQVSCNQARIQLESQQSPANLNK